LVSGDGIRVATIRAGAEVAASRADATEQHVVGPEFSQVGHSPVTRPLTGSGKIAIAAASMTALGAVLSRLGSGKQREKEDT
jgi:hypothetical protein